MVVDPRGRPCRARRISPLCALRRDRRRDGGRRSGQWQTPSPRASTARGSARQCRPAPHGTRSTAPCSTSKRRSAAEPPPRSPACPAPAGRDGLHAQPRYAGGDGARRRRRRGRPLLKVKLGGAGDAARIAAVRQAAPDARLIVDANEAWSEADLEPNMAACAAAGVELIEQPLPAGADEALSSIRRTGPGLRRRKPPHRRPTCPRFVGRYDAVNIKLDKTGGLTEGARRSRRGAAAGVQGDGRLHGRRRRWRWPRRFSSRSPPTSSTSTGRSSSPATASRASATRAASSIRRPRALWG